MFVASVAFANKNIFSRELVLLFLFLVEGCFFYAASQGHIYLTFQCL